MAFVVGFLMVIIGVFCLLFSFSIHSENIMQQIYQQLNILIAVIVFGIGAILMTIKGCFSDINKKIDLEQKNNTSNKTEN
ncbi:hypothetical protein IJI31_00455 [bacterium]|nr:hypothetical protein [bacterium]